MAFAVNTGDPLDTETDLWLLRIETADVLTAIDAAKAASEPTVSVSAADAVLVYLTKSTADVGSSYSNYDVAGGVALVNETAGSHSTNDHFIVAVTGGISVAIWNAPNQALRILTVDATALTLTAAVSFAGKSKSGLVDTNTTGSARHSEFDRSRRLVMVPDAAWIEGSVNPANNPHLLDTTDGFDNTDTVMLPALPGGSYVLQMASFAQLPAEDIVMVYKRVPISAEYSDMSIVLSDWGDIVLELYPGDLSVPVSTEVCLSASSDTANPTAILGNRPHLSRWRRWIITTWDTANFDGASTINHSCYLRVDAITRA